MFIDFYRFLFASMGFLLILIDLYGRGWSELSWIGLGCPAQLNPVQPRLGWAGLGWVGLGGAAQPSPDQPSPAQPGLGWPPHGLTRRYPVPGGPPRSHAGIPSRGSVPQDHTPGSRPRGSSHKITRRDPVPGGRPTRSHAAYLKSKRIFSKIR